MKIGILTYHRAHNYGAVLQCYALKEVLTKIGHDVSVIDYRQPQIEKRYRFRRTLSFRVFIEMDILKKIPYLFKRIIIDCWRFIVCQRRKSIFEAFQRKYLSLSNKCSKISEDYDVYVIGSDMLWANECMAGRFDANYFGEFFHKKNSKIIGYAISGTQKSFNIIAKDSAFRFLENFNAISIREKALLDIVKSVTNKHVEQCIDPTLLADKRLWSPIVDNKLGKRKYIVTYFLRMTSEDRCRMREKAIEFAKSKKLELINIDVTDNYMPITVEEFVSTLAFSQYTITDSFHGVIFSIIFNRPFTAIKMNDPHDARYVDIIRRFNIPECIADMGSTLNIPSIDYNQVETSVAEYRESSISFLRNNL